MKYPDKIIAQKLEVDVIVQVALLIIWAIEFMSGSGRASLAFYLVLGGYQFLSSMVHLFLQKPDAYFKTYYTQLIIYAPIFMATVLGENMVIGFFLLILTPLTATYYFVITLTAYRQTKSLPNK